MKPLVAVLVLSVASAMADEAAREPSFRRGSEVRLAALDGVDWLHGGPPKAFEPGKVYLFQCWSGLDELSVAALDRALALHEHFSDKGLQVYGIHAGEDSKDAVALWVKARSARMPYPVGWSGGKSGVETQWLKEARVTALPHAFVVRNGRLALSAQPSQLTDDAIRSLLDGGDGGERMTRILPEEEASRQLQTSVLLRDFRQAAAREDAEQMEKAIAALEKTDPGSSYLPSMRLELLLVRRQWDEAAEYLQRIPDGPARRITLAMTANRIANAGEGQYPPEFVASVAAACAARMAADGPRASPYEWATLAALQWRAGHREQAVAHARMAAETAAKPETAKGMPASVFERFAEQMEQGTPALLSDLSRWAAESFAESR